MKTIELLISAQGGIILFSYLVFFATFIHALVVNHKRKIKKKSFRSVDHYFGVILVSFVGFLPNELHGGKLNFHNLILFYFLIATIIYFIYFVIKDDHIDFTGSILMFMFASYLTSINLAFRTLIKGEFSKNLFLLLGLFFCLLINFVYVKFKRY
jgi:hypothetical protein